MGNFGFSNLPTHLDPCYNPPPLLSLDCYCVFNSISAWNWLESQARLGKGFLFPLPIDYTVTVSASPLSSNSVLQNSCPLPIMPPLLLTILFFQAQCR